MKKLILINIILIILLYVLPNEYTIKIPKNEQIGENIIENIIQDDFNENLVKLEEIQEIEIPIETPTTISQNGINLIKSFEGLELSAYKLNGEQNYTIGYGHYGNDVTENQTITEIEAENLLINDLQKFVTYVLDLNLDLNQNELDALVSFTYNCGQSSLNQLTKNRTKQEIAEHITLYTKSANEQNRQGLLKRREAEKELFLKEV